MKISEEGASRPKYSLKGLQAISDKLIDKLVIDNDRINDLIGILVLFNEDLISLETTIRDIDTIYEYEMLFSKTGIKEDGF